MACVTPTEYYDRNMVPKGAPRCLLSCKIAPKREENRKFPIHVTLGMIELFKYNRSRFPTCPKRKLTFITNVTAFNVGTCVGLVLDKKLKVFHGFGT